MYVPYICAMYIYIVLVYEYVKKVVCVCVLVTQSCLTESVKDIVATEKRQTIFSMGKNRDALPICMTTG